MKMPDAGIPHPALKVAPPWHAPFAVVFIPPLSAYVQDSISLSILSILF